MDDKLTKAADIKERFKNRSSVDEDLKLDNVLGKTKEREKIYSILGQERADENNKKREKHEKAKTNYRQTTLRVLQNDLSRLKKIQSRFFLENSLLTYEMVFLAGLESFEKMNDEDIRIYIEKKKENK